MIAPHLRYSGSWNTAMTTSFAPSILPRRKLPIGIQTPAQPDADQCNAARALALLASPRYARRPASDPTEVQRCIAALRNDWRD